MGLVVEGRKVEDKDCDDLLGWELSKKSRLDPTGTGEGGGKSSSSNLKKGRNQNKSQGQKGKGKKSRRNTSLSSDEEEESSAVSTAEEEEQEVDSESGGGGTGSGSDSAVDSETGEGEGEGSGSGSGSDNPTKSGLKKKPRKPVRAPWELPRKKKRRPKEAETEEDMVSFPSFDVFARKSSIKYLLFLARSFGSSSLGYNAKLGGGVRRLRCRVARIVETVLVAMTMSRERNTQTLNVCDSAVVKSL